MIKVPARSGVAQKAIEGDATDMTAFINSILKEYKGLNSVFVLNGQGACVAGITYAGESLVGKAYADRGYFKTAIQGKDAVDPHIVVAKNTGRQVFVIATPVVDKAGKTIGTVAVSINWLEYIKQRVFNIVVAEHGYAYIIDANSNTIIAHPDKSVHMRPLAPTTMIEVLIASPFPLFRLNAGFTQQVFKFRFIQHGYAQATRLVQLAARFFARHQIVQLFAHRT